MRSFIFDSFMREMERLDSIFNDCYTYEPSDRCCQRECNKSIEATHSDSPTYSKSNMTFRETKNGKIEVLATGVDGGEFSYTVNGDSFTLYSYRNKNCGATTASSCSVNTEKLPKAVKEESGKVYYNKKTKQLKIVFEPDPEPEDKFVEVETDAGMFKLN